MNKRKYINFFVVIFLFIYGAFFCYQVISIYVLKEKLKNSDIIKFTSDIYIKNIMNPFLYMENGRVDIFKNNIFFNNLIVEKPLVPLDSCCVSANNIKLNISDVFISSNIFSMFIENIFEDKKFIKSISARDSILKSGNDIWKIPIIDGGITVTDNNFNSGVFTFNFRQISGSDNYKYSLSFSGRWKFFNENEKINLYISNIGYIDDENLISLNDKEITFSKGAFLKKMKLSKKNKLILKNTPFKIFVDY